MGYATGLMRYSDDPLSDTSPTYVDVSSYVIGDVTWSDGKARDLDEPQAGSITFRLRNANGEWTPNSAGSLFANSPFILRRFSWEVNGTAEGIWYAVSWRLTNPAGTAYSEVEVTCVDGFEFLSLDNLALLDPPTASSYEEVVMQDAPLGYYVGDDNVGTQMAAVVGNEGVWTGLPSLGVAGLIVGEKRTAVQLVDTEDYGRAAIETNQFFDTNAISLECWVKPTTLGTSQIIIAGPWKTTVAEHVAYIDEVGSTSFRFNWLNTAGGLSAVQSTTGPAADTVFHVVGSWDGTTTRIYINGVLEATGAEPGEVLAQVTVADFLRIGSEHGDSYMSVVQHAAFYEYALSPERVLAHYQAGAERGLDSQLTHERVSELVLAVDLLGMTGTSSIHTVSAVMEHGQSRLDEIRAAVKADMPDAHFFMDGDGNAALLAWDYKSSSPYNEPQGTFGAGSGEIGYSGVEIVYDDEMFNEVTVGHEAHPGEESQHTVTDDDSISEFRRRAHAETGLTLTEHPDAMAVSERILELFSTPMTRVASLTVNGAHTDARAQILERQIGDLIRVRSVDDNVDVVTTILGKSKTLTAAGHLTCTWSTARGFDASGGYWHLGIVGFSGLGTSTVLA